MPFAYMVEDDNVYVATIEYYCDECSFATIDQREEIVHYRSTGHFTRSRILGDKQRWNEEKHGPLPGWVLRKVGLQSVSGR